MTEIELKLRLTPADALRLQAHPALRGVMPVQHRLGNVYLDTRDAQLRQHGLALRLRRLDDDWLQTLKTSASSEAGLTRRLEWEVPISGGALELSAFPPEAQARLTPPNLPAGLLAAIEPCFSTDFQRRAWRFDFAGAALEVALDEGEICAAGRTEPLCELEIECFSGAPAAVLDLALVLLDDLPLQPEARSKAQRGYVLAGMQPPVPAAPELSREAIRTAWLEMRTRLATSDQIAG